MLNSYFQRGVTLVELMISLVIGAVLLSLGVPSFMSWIQNSQIRTAAEAIQNGLQLARVEAVRRNAPVRFQLVTNVTASCALAPVSPSTTSGSWAVSQDDPSAACNIPPSETTAPRIIQVRNTAEGSPNAVVTAETLSLIIFNGLGRVTPVPPGNLDFNITNLTGGNCIGATIAGPMRCLRVSVSTGGQIRMCDPAKPSSDPQGC
ncbi:MAG: GspH/FimT family pseudopilin [Betaproteobacteria bacterium]|nr:GspH/FimT family pseudopilin [Betaproteobacteria bacterium]